MTAVNPVVTMAPTAALPPNTTPAQWLPSPGGKAGCPPGLEHLVDIQQMTVVEDINLTDLLPGIHAPDRFSIRNGAGQQMYFVGEIPPVQRFQFYRDYNVLDSANRLCFVLRMTSNGYYSGCLPRCTMAVMEVRSSDGTVMGHVATVCGCCEIKVELRDAAHEPLLFLNRGACAPYMAPLDLKDQDQKIGSLAIVSGFARGRMSAVVPKVFTTEFPRELPPTSKALLLASMIFFDALMDRGRRNRRHHH